MGEQWGLALGSGSSRGWSHIGVIRALRDHGIIPQVVTGTSIGALVGAAYVCGKLDDLETWARRLKKTDIMRFLSLSTTLSGVVHEKRLRDFLLEVICGRDCPLETLALPYGAISTNIQTGTEHWHLQGSLVQAMEASMAFPGMFPAVHIDDGWFIDGGLVNPVPVTLARHLGAQKIIAVNLNSDIVGKHFTKTDRLHPLLKRFGVKPTESGILAPTLWETLASSVNIMQATITRSRLVQDKPDILIEPQLAHIGLFELDRASEAIDQGYLACTKVLEGVLSAQR